ncbi:NAD(P)H-dependent oxidoreductase [Zooshikella marina]|uniref:NADPH-dependent FMN reductase n=1 Tax=Zooshikella ganghwensis TaxID=202772 RepID=UPI001BAED502|nr:NADPH-dependent FMN reductase [Zooshikella ganghwensis]MBU2706695.1 NAD(P)H-dependent oxidoreductase [Zooshikella ganghwensis]
MEVLFINGSLSKKSYTQALITYLSSLFDQTHQLREWSFKETPLPFMIPELYGCDTRTHPNENVRSFFEAVISANVIVLASPTYHGTISGVLKNALDYLQKGIFSGKTVVAISVGGGIRVSAQTCEAIRSVVRALGSNCLVDAIASGAPDFTENENVIKLIDPVIQSRCRAIVDEILSRHQCKS